MASLGQRRYALQAANEVLDDFGVDQTRPVDIFDLVSQLGLFLVFNKLDNLLGAVVPKGGGVMVTDQRGPAVQRYTAAHEIGHWILDFNEPAFDREEDIFYPDVDRERLAQLFAGQLLMPPPLVFEMCAQHGISNSNNATGPAVYLVARDMGASYEAATRQLASLEIIDAPRRDYLLSLTPAQVKTELCHGHRPVGSVDIWPIDLAAAGTEVHVTTGDEVVLLLPENQSTGHRWLTRDELESRSNRRVSPAPADFADGSGDRSRVVTSAGQDTGQRQPARVLRRSLSRLPGNSEAKRTLPGRSPDLDEEAHRFEEQLEISALKPAPIEIRTVDESFAPGWTTVPPSAARSVRQAIAGREDLVLPESTLRYADPSAGAGRGRILVESLPVSATGERIIALNALGEGIIDLDLVYSSAYDPSSPAAASFHIEIAASATPALIRRRQLLRTERPTVASADAPELP